MSIWGKIITAFRGAATEVGEAVVDNQAIRILEQEMREARKHLDEAKENLARIMAQQMGVKRDVKRLQEKVADHEAYAGQALDKGDEALALDIAQKIAELGNELEAQEKVLESYTATIAQLRQTIKTTDRNIKSMEREVAVVKTTASVQKASAAAASKFSGTDSAMRSATDSLARIKQKQQQRSDQMKAAMEMQQDESGEDLQAKLRAAGIVSSGSSGNAVLERLKAKRGGASSTANVEE